MFITPLLTQGEIYLAGIEVVPCQNRSIMRFMHYENFNCITSLVWKNLITLIWLRFDTFLFPRDLQMSVNVAADWFGSSTHQYHETRRKLSQNAYNQIFLISPPLQKRWGAGRNFRKFSQNPSLRSTYTSSCKHPVVSGQPCPEPLHLTARFTLVLPTSIIPVRMAIIVIRRTSPTS
jgi:hypothetical protein